MFELIPYSRGGVVLSFRPSLHWNPLPLGCSRVEATALWNTGSSPGPAEPVPGPVPGPRAEGTPLAGAPAGLAHRVPEDSARGEAGTGHKHWEALPAFHLVSV